MAQGLKTGDTVTIIAGDHKGETGKIVKMDVKGQKAMIEGIGVVERHLKRSQFNPQGGKKQVHLGIHLSNLKKAEGKKK